MAIRRSTCGKREYKRALRELISDMGYSTVAKVPKHVRVALRSNAEHLAKVRCTMQRTGYPYLKKRRGKKR